MKTLGDLKPGDIIYFIDGNLNFFKYTIEKISDSSDWLRRFYIKEPNIESLVLPKDYLGCSARVDWGLFASIKDVFEYVMNGNDFEFDID